MKSAFHLLRYVDRDSIVHRTNARTKILSMSAMALCLAFRPGWIAVAGIWSLGAVTFIAARLPVGCIPRFPKIVSYGLLSGLVLGAISGGEPNVNIGSWVFGAGGLVIQIRFSLVTLGLLFLSLLLGWTTPPSELPGAVRFILRPFRAVRLPVDDVVAGLALAVRVMPLLMDELASTFTLWKARRDAQNLRTRSASIPASPEAGTKNVPSTPGPASQRADLMERTINDVIAIAATSTTSAVRRSTEIGRAMRAKGSTEAPVTESSWGLPDFIAAVVTICTVVAVFVLDS